MQPFLCFDAPLAKAIFIRRRQRFLIEASVGGKSITAYCANPGSFQGCLESGKPVLLAKSISSTRKRAYTWKAIKIADTWVGTDTHLANKLVESGIERGMIRELADYRLEKKEPKTPRGRRLDFLLSNDNRKCYLEVKSSTVAVAGFAQYPDSISPRAVSHLRALRDATKLGHEAILLFLIQRGDVSALKINRGRDPLFDSALDEAVDAGVKVVAIKHSVSPRGFGSPVAIPVFTRECQNMHYIIATGHASKVRPLTTAD